MIKTTTYATFFELVKRRLENDFGAAEFTVTDNEIALYMYPAMATVITQMSNNSYAVDGIRSIPEGFITTFKFDASSFTKNTDTGCFEVTLPQPPINLPLGYSIISPFFTKTGKKSYPLIAIHPYQKGYALRMATPSYGVFYEVEGTTLIMTTQENLLTSGMKLHVPMQSSRGATGSDTDTINLGDEALGLVFDQVIAKLTGRVSQGKDNVNDGVSKKTDAA